MTSFRVPITKNILYLVILILSYTLDLGALGFDSMFSVEAE